MIENTTITTDSTTQPQNSRVFNPNEHLMQIKNRGGSADYLPCQWRLVWFRSLFPQGTIDTEELEVDLDRECEAEVSVWNNETRRSEKVLKKAKGYARYKAIVCDGIGGRATGTKSERAVDFPDYIEKAETGAIGRALAGLGYGTQFAGDEFDEKHRIADAPVDRGDAPARAAQHEHPTQQQRAGASIDEGGAVTEQQISSLQTLARRLQRDIDIPPTFGEAKELIAQLSREFNESRRKAS